MRICLAFDPKLKNKMIIELFSKEFYLIIISFLASFMMVAFIYLWKFMPYTFFLTKIDIENENGNDQFNY